MAITGEEQVSIDEHVRRAAAAADVDALADEMTARLFDELPTEHASDPEMWRAGHDSVRDNVVVLFDLLAGRPDGTDPEGPVAFAVLAVDAGLSSRDLERLYRRGQALAFDMWRQIATSYARDQDVPLSPLLDQPNERIHRFLDAMLVRVLGAHDAAVARRRGSREERRSRLAMQVVSGELNPDRAEVDEFLGYRLAAEHLALHVRTNQEAVSVVARKSLVSATGASHLLAVRDADPRRWVIWLADGEDTPALRSLLAELPMVGAFALGGGGLDGFRRSYERASRAAAARSLFGGAGVVAARDVHLETLLLADPRLARDFSSVELGTLGDDSRAAARLRTTLLAFFEAGSQVGAAAALKVHGHTVRNHIRHAEELLGFSLASRRTELELALRLRELLGPVDGPDAGVPTSR